MIEKEIGLFYPKERYSDLEDTLRFSLKINDEKKLKDYINNYLNSESYTKLHHDELSQALTIGETYYFRKGSGFEQMEQIIIPSLIQEKANSDRSIRIWSAGCSQGDEPYSIAILIDKLLPNREGWNIHILGTDINKKSLEKAESGIARKWSFRSLDEDIVNRYFTKINDVEYKILPSIKNMVSFGYLNLIEDYYPSLENGTNALDLVLCNNTLMYFSPLHSAIKPSTPSIKPGNVEDSLGPEKKIILVAEDTMTTRLLFKNILESARYTVITASDGVEALEILNKQHIDLLITDIEMPRMTGFELIEKIHSTEKMKDLPVIIITARESLEDKRKGIELGADAYIEKSSFVQSELISITKKLL